MKLYAVIEPSDEGGYTATVPALPGCISEGDTREEALANIREAIELYLEPVEREENMPTISMFYGIIVSLYFIDNKQHKKPHIHVKYQGDEAVVSISDGEALEGRLPPAKMRLVLAWIEIHKDELMADWDLAVNGQQPYKIEPLR